MSDKNNTLQGILDIAPPAAPWQHTWETNAADIVTTSLILLSLLTLIGFIVWRQHFSYKAQARRRIYNLAKQVKAKHISDKYAAFQLADILRESFGLTQLSPCSELPAPLKAHQLRWQAFNESLAISRYANQSDTQPIQELIDDAHCWLRQWPK